ncbi:hypothetical protein BHQ15_12495 [Mycolicibacillus koreensis]|nr:hypothetical protein BHQ15_12495 [Mycolicibacillus koreensis]
MPGFRVVVTEQTRHGTANRHTFVVADEPDKTGAEPWQHLTAETTEQLPVSLDLAPGVSVSARALTTILDALCIDGRHNVDIADLAVVISQLGHRLNAIDTIAGPQRQHAERALYNVILSRCTSSM